MSDEKIDIGEISDVTNSGDEEPSAEELNRTMPKSPPSKAALEKDTNKLRSKYKILRTAIIEEQITQLEQSIADVEKGTDETLLEKLEDIEDKRAKQAKIAHERKRYKVEAILNEYKSRLQSISNEKEAIEVELRHKIQEDGASEGDDDAVPNEIAKVQSKVNTRFDKTNGKESILDDLQQITASSIDSVDPDADRDRDQDQDNQVE